MNSNWAKKIEKDGFLRTIFNLTDSPQTFIHLMEMDGKGRLEVMTIADGKVALSDIEMVKIKVASRLAKRKSLS